MSSLVGKRLQGGKYKLESVLGRGGFGLTFRAHQTYLEQVVVIKTLNESFWTAPNLEELQRQFQDEGRRLAMCQHPNVVRVTDFFVEDYLPYMVMDYIPGRSLYDIIFDNQSGPQPLSEPVAVQYIQQIGSALQAVHNKGLLHRDVKPQNIMVIRPSSLRCANVSTPLPIRSSHATSLGPSTTNESSPFGDMLILPPLDGAVATKNICCLAMNSEISGVISSYRVAMDPSVAFRASHPCGFDWMEP